MYFICLEMTHFYKFIFFLSFCFFLFFVVFFSQPNGLFGLVDRTTGTKLDSQSAVHTRVCRYVCSRFALDCASRLPAGTPGIWMGVQLVWKSDGYDLLRWKSSQSNRMDIEVFRQQHSLVRDSMGMVRVVCTEYRGTVPAREKGTSLDPQTQPLPWF